MKVASKSNAFKLAFALVGGGVVTQTSAEIAHADVISDTRKTIAKKPSIANTKAKPITIQNSYDANEPKIHVVKQGESVSSIAQQYGLKTEDVLKWNNLSWSNSTIYIDDKLILQDPNNLQEKYSSTRDTVSTDTNSNAQNIKATQAEQIVNLAIQYAHMGIPYTWGGTSIQGFDCSGLTQYVYHQAGITIGRSTVDQEANVQTTDISDASQVAQFANPGDLLFWGNHGSSYHVAIYIGNNQFVAAPQPGQNVDIETVSNYFKPSFVGKVTL